MSEIILKPASDSTHLAEVSRSQSTTVQSTSAPVQPGGTTVPMEGYLAIELEHAELLLNYAVEAGIEVDNEVRDGILKARFTSAGGGVTQAAAADLLSSLTKLAATLRPVTAESLRKCSNRKAVLKDLWVYEWVAIVLAVAVVLFSLITAVTNQISASIEKELQNANAQAVTLTYQLGAPPVPTPTNLIRLGDVTPKDGATEKEVTKELQSFAISIRAAQGQARLLNWFLFFRWQDKLSVPELELPADLRVLYSVETVDLIGKYQKVRAYGETIRQEISVFYGAFGASFLPALYALLGACACFLRSYRQQINAKTYVGTAWPIAHLLTALINGLVVGMFNVNQSGTSLSPLAIAFLVGYGTEVFFSFLDGLLQMFKGGNGAGGQAGGKVK